MSDNEWIDEAETEWLRGEDAATTRFVAFVERWPNYRVEAAMRQLGGAIAVADLMGVNGEELLVAIRKAEPHPGVLKPPRAS